jgi:hypothetical protein
MSTSSPSFLDRFPAAVDDGPRASASCNTRGQRDRELVRASSSNTRIG